MPTTLHAPVITSNSGGDTATLSIAENTTAVTTVTATDQDAGSHLVYSISGGLDASKFTINTTTGVVTFRSAPDFEAPTDAGGDNVYNLIVKVSDGQLSDTQAIAVTVTNVSGVTITGTGGDDVVNATTTVGGQPLPADNDIINGLAGNDSLDGGLGNDTMTGGIGNDTYFVDNIGDVTTELVGEGTDTVKSSITWALAANVENLVLTGLGYINGTGNDLDNTITGNAGGNKINGGLGADTMIGGNGSDTYYFDNNFDVITELASQGNDSVFSSRSFDMSVKGVNVENLTLTGSAALSGAGNELNNIITGNSGNNVLSGAAGSDKINGGVGADTMTGGTGDDVYTVDNALDTVTEALNEGKDSVVTNLAYTLGANVENLTIGGSAAVNGTGNALDNIINGNNAANTLTGFAGNDTLNGGNGSDTMIGGIGNDIYSVNVAGDVVTENAGEGTDLVQSNISYTLGSDVENLTLTGATVVSGVGISGTGNTLDNVITGNSTNNTLTGLAGNDKLDGGLGNDTMVGGIGNDTYVVNAAGDVVTEGVGEGTDTTLSSATRTLSANVENLTLTGATAIGGTGNTLNNIITGNIGANALDGGDGNDTILGGDGNDTIVGGIGNDLITGGQGIDAMNGGVGADTFIYTSLDDSGTVEFTRDTITGFLVGTDKINLSAIDANNAVALDQAFVLDTDNSFSAGEIKLEIVGSDLWVSVNTDADAAADMSFIVSGLTNLSASDFIL